MIKWKKMGSIQPGLPHPRAVLPSYNILVLDIKDWLFFHIPLAPQNQDCLTFTVWEPNINKTAKRYQWAVLPQGNRTVRTASRSSSYVSQALVNIPKKVLLIHRTDDLLKAHPDAVYLQRTAKNGVKRPHIITFDGGTR